MKTSVRWLWRIFLFGVFVFSLTVVSFYYDWWGVMPSLAEIENPSSSLSSEVYAADGTLMGRYFVQDRSNSKYSEISPNVYNALIATEDVRFYNHSGIDGKAVVRAIVRMGRDGGGSTISQQLALNLFNGERARNKMVRVTQKLKEWVLAVKLERNLTKNEIITLYLNTVPFPDNVFGIKNASLTFFNKTPDKLSIDEAAVLIGSLKGNTIYNPRSHPERSLNRRNTVIEQMVAANMLTETQAKVYKSKELKLDYHKLSYHEGLAPYFRQVVEAEVKNICKTLRKPDGSNYDIYRDGLKIYTTVDMRMQRYAEEAVEQHMKDIQKLFSSQHGYSDYSVWKTTPGKSALKRAMKDSERYRNMKEEQEDITEEEILKVFNTPVKMKVFAWNKEHVKDTVMTPMDSIMYTRTFLQAGFMAMDPLTGEVKAWVGGINHDFYQYDHVNINTKRQVGSTIKPLLYCLAVDNGISPCGIVSTSPQQFPGRAAPYNAGGSKYGSMQMKKALALSVNNAALYLLKQVGIPAFVDFAHKCGISSKIDPYPSTALGVSSISLFEMLWSYTMFPGSGMNTQPYFISRIEDKNGIVLKNFAPQQKEIIPANTAYKMVKMMRGVVDFGTASRIRRSYGITAEAAGKTGTTNDQADGWFIGYTPQLLAGAWVGCDDRFLSFRSTALGQGAAAALPIWALFFKKIYADKDLEIRADAKFDMPKDFNDCDYEGYYGTSSHSGSSQTNEDDDYQDVNTGAETTPNEWVPADPQ